MNNRNSKPLPLVVGCMAIFIDGDNIGRTVTVQAQLFPGQPYFIEGKRYMPKDHHTGYWHCAGRVIDVTLDSGVVEQRSTCVASGENLMRIDGNNDAFSSEDIAIYSLENN